MSLPIIGFKSKLVILAPLLRGIEVLAYQKKKRKKENRDEDTKYAYILLGLASF